MKQPVCDCIRKALNQFNEVYGITATAEVYYLQKNSDKGLEEKSLFLKSLCCPECGKPYREAE